MQDTQVLSLGCEDPLEKEMATHSSILAWEIPWTEEPGGPQSMEMLRVGHYRACMQTVDCDGGNTGELLKFVQKKVLQLLPVFLEKLTPGEVAAM